MKGRQTGKVHLRRRFNYCHDDFKIASCNWQLGDGYKLTTRIENVTCAHCWPVPRNRTIKNNVKVFTLTKEEQR